MPVIISSVISEFRLQSASVVYASGIGSFYGTAIYGTSSYGALSSNNPYFSGSLAQIQDYLPQGINNQRYAGSKMSSSAFNINSTQTIDGGPVVEWRTANPNQLIYQQAGEQGSFVLV